MKKTTKAKARPAPARPAAKLPAPPQPGYSLAANLLFGLFVVSLFTPVVYSDHTFFGFITERTWFFNAVVDLMALVAVFMPGFLSAKLSRLQVAVLVFLTVLFVADGLGADPVQSYFSGYAHMEGFLIYVHLGLYFFILAQMPLSKARWHAALLLSTGLAVVVVLNGYFSTNGWQPIDHRLIATVGNPSYLAAYLLIHVFIAVYLCTQFTTVSRWVTGSLAGIVLVILVGGIYLTSTRSAVVGLVAGVLYLTVFSIWRQYRSVPRMLIGLAVLAVGLWGLFGIARNTEFLQKIPAVYRLTNYAGNNNTLQPRYVCWKIAIDGIAERPLLGWGQENFSYGFARYYDPAILSDGAFEWYDRPHNILLDWAFSAGIIGLLAYLFIWFSLVRSVRTTNTRLNVAEKGVLAAAFVAYFFFNLLNFDSLLTLQIFFLLLAFVDTPPAPVLNLRPRPVWAIPLRIAAIVLVLFLANYAVLEPYRTLRQLDKQEKMSDVQQRIMALEQIYQQASVRKPDLADCLESLTLSVLQADLPTETKQFCYQRAARAVTEQVGKHPGYTRLMARAAALFSAGGETDKAINLYREVNRIEGGKRPSAYIQLGSAYLAKQALPQAMAAFDQAYRLYPQAEDPLLYKALIAAAQRDTVQCYGILRRISTRTLVDRLPFVKRIYKQAGDPHQFVVRLMQTPDKERYTPSVFVEWALASFDVNDGTQMTNAINSFYNLYFRNRYDYALMKQVIDDGKRGIRPERLKTIAQDMAW